MYMYVTATFQNKFSDFFGVKFVPFQLLWYVMNDSWLNYNKAALKYIPKL